MISTNNKVYFVLFLITTCIICYYVLSIVLPERKISFEYGNMVVLGKAVKTLPLASGRAQIIEFQYNNKKHQIQDAEDVDFYKMKLFYLIKVDTIKPENSKDWVRIKNVDGLDFNQTYIIGMANTFHKKSPNDSSIVNVCFSLNNKHVCLKSMTIFSGDSTFIIKPNYEFPENSTVKKLEDIIYNN